MPSVHECIGDKSAYRSISNWMTGLPFRYGFNRNFEINEDDCVDMVERGIVNEVLSLNQRMAVKFACTIVAIMEHGPRLEVFDQLNILIQYLCNGFMAALRLCTEQEKFRDNIQWKHDYYNVTPPQVLFTYV